VSKPFAIYCRASTDGPEGLSSNPEDQEEAGRKKAERLGLDIADVVVEVASGALAADDRELGALIARCESGELGGIIIRDEKRFARDEIAGGVALARLVECDARLISTWTGFDSGDLTPESQMVFDIMMAVGKAERARNRLRRAKGSRKLALAGYYLASSPPLGYDLVDRKEGKNGPGTGVGKLVINKKAAKAVVRAFEMRADDKASYVEIADWLTAQGYPTSKSGVRVMLTNRCYVGEATMPQENGKKGQLERIYNAHAPLITPDLWERAQLDMPYHPRDNKWAALARVGGLARCSGCGRRLSACGGGNGQRYGSYNCSAPKGKCPERASIRMSILDDFIDDLMKQAMYDREPHVVAIIEGSDRYARALEEVEIARTELETWITQVKVTDVGKDVWVQGKEAREGALETARRELRAIPAPKPSKDFPVDEFTLEEAEPGLAREFNTQFVDRIVVRSVGKGRRVSPQQRCDVFLIGAEEPYALREIVPNPNVTMMPPVAA
jgi:DNA invertase Pin-like site-specific DNA recombinase